MNDLIRAVHAKYNAYAEHAVQVATLSTRLFVELQPLHRLGEGERHVLTQAAYLHDIGHFIHKKKHHKHSHHLILHDRLLDEWDQATRHCVALLALNHRKKKTQGLGDLPQPLRDILRTLTAILRIADVLDYEHEQKTTIKGIHIDEQAERITISIAGMPLLAYEQKVRDKLFLAADVFRMSITIENESEEIRM